MMPETQEVLSALAAALKRENELYDSQSDEDITVRIALQAVAEQMLQWVNSKGYSGNVNYQAFLKACGV